MYNANSQVNELGYLLKTLKDVKIDIKFINGFNTLGAIMTITDGTNVEIKQINKPYESLQDEELAYTRQELLKAIIVEVRRFNNTYPPEYIEARKLMLSYMSQLQAKYDSQFVKGELVLLTNPRVDIYNMRGWSIKGIAEMCFKIYFNQGVYSNIIGMLGGSSIYNFERILKTECSTICEIREDYLKDVEDIFEDYRNEDKEINIETEWYSEKKTPLIQEDLEELGFEQVIALSYEKIFPDKKVMVRLLGDYPYVNPDLNFPKLKITGCLIFVHNFNEDSWKVEPSYEGELKSQKHLCELLNEYGK
jgi:hypothetical protein